MVATLRLSAPVLGSTPTSACWASGRPRRCSRRRFAACCGAATRPSAPPRRPRWPARPGAAMALFGKRSLAPPRARQHRRSGRCWRSSGRLRRYLGGWRARWWRRGDRASRAPGAGGPPGALPHRGALPGRAVDEFQDVNPVQGAFFLGWRRPASRWRWWATPSSRSTASATPTWGCSGRPSTRPSAPARSAAAHRDPPPRPAVAAWLNRLTAGLASARSASGRARHHRSRRWAPGGVEGRWGCTGWWATPPWRAARREGALLARPCAAPPEGTPFDGMAVLARSYGGLAVAEEALRAAGSPA